MLSAARALLGGTAPSVPGDYRLRFTATEFKLCGGLPGVAGQLFRNSFIFEITAWSI
jgi:hypothetical protein